MKAVRPRGVPTGNATPWLILGLAGAVYGSSAAVWVAARTASLLTGHGWSNGPGFGTAFIGDLIKGRFTQMWPGVPGWLIGVFTVLQLAGLAVLGWLAWKRLGDGAGAADDPLRSLATAHDVQAFTPAAVAARAVQLRTSLTGTPADEVSPPDAGVLVGTLRPRGPQLRSSWEDVLLAFMAPRSAKTTALAVPTVLTAPGACVATSNKADLWAATVADRTTDGRTAWVFDPQSITFAAQSWWWNPLAEIDSVEEAERLAGHFVLTVDDPRSRDIWGPGATELLSAMLLAAAIERRTMFDVYLWLTDDGSQEPVDILESRPEFAAQAAGVRGIQTAAPETKSGFYVTARTAARSMRDPLIMAWVTPPDRPVPEFDVEAFVSSRDTLYLLSKDGGASAAPLIAALTDRVMREAVRRAETLGGRLDPPMLIVLDEAANVCRIADLPALYSHLGSRAVIVLTILQSWAQGESVWGQGGMQALWSSATVKLIGSGIDDDRFAEVISRLVGDHDVTVASYSRSGRDHGLSEQVQLRRQRILDAAAVRALPKGTALLLATGARAAMIELLPWWRGPDAKRITEARDAAEAELRVRATAAMHRRQQDKLRDRRSPAAPAQPSGTPLP